jgi:hypothetical protein
MKWFFALVVAICVLKDWFGAHSDELHAMFRTMVFFVSVCTNPMCLEKAKAE